MNGTAILFPGNLDGSRSPDTFMAKEFQAAKAAGFETGLFDQSIMFDAPAELFALPKEACTFLYRGWIIREEAYSQLDSAIRGGGKGIKTTRHEYSKGTNLPEWYPSLEGHTPHSFWITQRGLKTLSLEEIALYVKQSTYGQPLILKDYLKSRKHEWLDACFIPDPWDTEHVVKVIENFLKLQADTLWGGLVFRDFVEFKMMGNHPKSRTPIIHEVRQFYYRQNSGAIVPFYSNNYWPDLDSSIERPSEEYIQNIGNLLNLSFFVVDFGLTEKGYWIPIEVNDGGSAGLPSEEDTEKFYVALKRIVDE